MSKIVEKWISDNYGPVTHNHYWSEGFRHKDNAPYLQSEQTSEGFNVDPKELPDSPKDKDGYIAIGTTISEYYDKQVLRHVVKENEKLEKNHDRSGGFTQNNLELLRREIQVYNDIGNDDNLNPNYQNDGIFLSRGDRFYSKTGMTLDDAQALLQDRSRSRPRPRSRSRGRFQSPSPSRHPSEHPRPPTHRIPGPKVYPHKGGSRRSRSKSQKRNRRRTRRH